jgi:hypothetical protein
MGKRVAVGLAGLMAIAILAATPAASASGKAALASGSGDVTKSGTCGSRPWTLELSPDNGKIEADYELHHVKAGSTWRVVMKDNGVRFFRGTRTAGAERYIEVDKYTANHAGRDKITVRATNLANGAVCTASASIS